MPTPHRRHRLTLVLEADSLAELVGVLHYLADEMEVEGREQRDLRYDGHSAAYTARLRSEPTRTDSGNEPARQVTDVHGRPEPVA